MKTSLWMMVVFVFIAVGATLHGQGFQGFSKAGLEQKRQQIERSEKAAADLNKRAVEEWKRQQEFQKQQEQQRQIREQQRQMQERHNAARQQEADRLRQMLSPSLQPQNNPAVKPVDRGNEFHPIPANPAPARNPLPTDRRSNDDSAAEIIRLQDEAARRERAARLRAEAEGSAKAQAEAAARRAVEDARQAQANSALVALEGGGVDSALAALRTSVDAPSSSGYAASALKDGFDLTPAKPAAPPARVSAVVEPLKTVANVKNLVDATQDLFGALVDDSRDAAAVRAAAMKATVQDAASRLNLADQLFDSLDNMVKSSVRGDTAGAAQAGKRLDKATGNYADGASARALEVMPSKLPGAAKDFKDALDNLFK